MSNDMSGRVLMSAALVAGAGCVLLLLSRARAERRYRFMKTLAEKDSLTLLYNHGAFHERLVVEIERAARYERDLSAIMIDLDGFKSINDTFGHLVGDEVLLLTASILGTYLRKSDIAARYGGDEFAVILPETDLEAAGAIAGRISSGITEASVKSRTGEVVRFTASIGYAVCRPESSRRGDILGEADRLMFESKRHEKGGVRGMQI